MQINGIKTKASALAAVDASPLPAIPEIASDAQKAIIQRQIELETQFKAFIKQRIAAVPDSIEIIGIEVSANAGELEAGSYRIIQHK